ncbi:MAG: DNA polymerase Y family protein [Sphingomonadales bacterium]|nr:DNA polymerase Y family protein [Sphingomonadales bacterium]
MTNASSVKRRYLALWFPFLPTDRLRQEEAGGEAGRRPDTPLVLAAKLRGALRIRAVSSAAQALGLAPDMMLADARALVPDLAVAEMDESADRHFLKRLGQHCMGWSPRVALDPPGGITMDIAGGEHLFGGERGLVAEVEDAMACIGLTLRLAVASTAEAAQALARHGRGERAADERAAIRALPVIALGLDAEASMALTRAGLRTVGDLASRPASALAARFGMAAVTALHRLLGDEQAPIATLSPPEPLHFERRFAEQVALQSSIAACFAELLREAASRMAQRGLGARRFVLTLFRSDGARHRLEIATGLATRDPAVALRLFDERIAALADPLDPGFGYDRITLFLPQTEPLGPQQPELGGEERQEAVLADLIDRLSTRFGAGSIRRLVPRDSHVPEQAQLALPAIEVSAPVAWPAPPPGEPPLRPLFLFDPPQPVEVIAEVPDGPPHRFRWKRKLHEVRLYEGPERIAAEWWRRQGGENGPGEGAGKAGLTRDYYRVEDVRGRRYWLFRHGLYGEKAIPRWYVHGLFA